MNSDVRVSERVNPFLKWPGGKRWLVPFIRNLLNGERYQRYFEPFLGGGAVFFGIRPECAYLSDINTDLVNTYIQVKWRPHSLIRKLRRLPIDKTTYLKLRLSDPTCRLDSAVRFLYLNRTAFGGMYRLNRDGLFNVPFGGGQRTPASLWKDQLLLNASASLRKATIVSEDFEKLLQKAGPGDLVYCDPTYTVSHNNNCFIRYNEKNFSWTDQKRLALVCKEIAEAGATVLVSNAFHREIRKLYQGAEAHILDRMSLLCPEAQKRRVTQEYLFALWPINRS